MWWHWPATEPRLQRLQPQAYVLAEPWEVEVAVQSPPVLVAHTPVVVCHVRLATTGTPAVPVAIGTPIPARTVGLVVVEAQAVGRAPPGLGSETERNIYHRWPDQRILEIEETWRHEQTIRS